MDVIRPLLRWLPSSWQAAFDDLQRTVYDTASAAATSLDKSRDDMANALNKIDAAKRTLSGTWKQSNDAMQDSTQATMDQEQAWMEQQVAAQNVAGDTSVAFEGMAGAIEKVGAAASYAAAETEALTEVIEKANRLMDTPEGRGEVLRMADQASARRMDIQSYMAHMGAEGERRLRAHAASRPQYDQSRLESDIVAMYASQPKFHTGTRFFNPPGGRREGLAILERGEMVVPRGQSAGQVVLNISGNHISGDYDVDRIGDQIVKKLRLAGVV